MSRLEVADIFRAHGPAWRDAERGHFSLGQMKVMSAIEQCRSAALGGHALRCSSCAKPRSPTTPAATGTVRSARAVLRSAGSKPDRPTSCRCEYYHVVFTLPAPISAIAYTNKEMIYGLLFDLAAETLRTIAADPKHLGARIGTTLVLHTWGSALTHHPHVHGIVPGGGLALDADRWVPCKPGFFLSVRVLSRLFRRRFLEELQNAHRDGQLKFFGEHVDLADADAFADWLVPLRQCEWVVYAKRPFAGTRAVLAYLSRYTHRVAISNSRLVASDDRGVTFRWKDYRAKGRTRYKTMTLATEEFMRRFLLHVLPSGFHRIRHYGLLANANRKRNIATARELLHQPAPPPAADPGTDGTDHGARPTFVCRHCGAPMLIIETFARAQHIRGPPGSPLDHERQRFNRHIFAVGTSSNHAVAYAHCLVLQNAPVLHVTNTPLQRSIAAAHLARLRSRVLHAAAVITCHIRLLPIVQIPIAHRTC